MDDMVILSASKEFLHFLYRKIQEFVFVNLKLTMKSSWQVFPIESRGVDFVGYRTFPEFTLVRKRTVKNMKKSVKVISVKIKEEKEINHHDYCSMASYTGCLIHGNSYRLKEKYIGQTEVVVQEYYEKYLKKSSKKGAR